MTIHDDDIEDNMECRHNTDAKLALQHRRQLSALVDGDLAPGQARFLMRRLGHDQDLAGRWQRWQLIGDVLRGQKVAAMPMGSDAFSSRVADAVARDGARPASGPRMRWQHGIGLAAAASVAAVALFIARPVSVDSELPGNAAIVASSPVMQDVDPTPAPAEPVREVSVPPFADTPPAPLAAPPRARARGGAANGAGGVSANGGTDTSRTGSAGAGVGSTSCMTGDEATMAALPGNSLSTDTGRAMNSATAATDAAAARPMPCCQRIRGPDAGRAPSRATASATREENASDPMGIAATFWPRNTSPISCQRCQRPARSWSCPSLRIRKRACPGARSPSTSADNCRRCCNASFASVLWRHSMLSSMSSSWMVMSFPRAAAPTARRSLRAPGRSASAPCRSDSPCAGRSRRSSGPRPRAA